MPSPPSQSQPASQPDENTSPASPGARRPAWLLAASKIAVAAVRGGGAPQKAAPAVEAPEANNPSQDALLPLGATSNAFSQPNVPAYGWSGASEGGGAGGAAGGVAVARLSLIHI